jgi:TonB family protein
VKTGSEPERRPYLNLLTAKNSLIQEQSAPPGAPSNIADSRHGRSPERRIHRIRLCAGRSSLHHSKEKTMKLKTAIVIALLGVLTQSIIWLYESFGLIQYTSISAYSVSHLFAVLTVNLPLALFLVVLYFKQRQKATNERGIPLLEAGIVIALSGALMQSALWFGRAFVFEISSPMWGKLFFLFTFLSLDVPFALFLAALFFEPKQETANEGDPHHRLQKSAGLQAAIVIALLGALSQIVLWLGWIFYLSEISSLWSRKVLFLLVELSLNVPLALFLMVLYSRQKHETTGERERFVDDLLLPDGRLNRARYLGRVLLINLLLYIVIPCVVIGAFYLVQIVGLPWPRAVEFLMMAVPIGLFMVCLAVVVAAFQVSKRLHDLGRPGWHYWLLLVPFYNLYLSLVLLFQKGNYGSNLYGPDPLANEPRSSTADDRAIARPQVKKTQMNSMTRKILLAGGSLLVLVALAVTVMGWAAYRYWHPSPSGAFPQQVGRYTRTHLVLTSGRVGSDGRLSLPDMHTGDYTSSDGKEVMYKLFVYSSPEEAQLAVLADDSPRTAAAVPEVYVPEIGGQVLRRGVLKDRDGQQIGTRIVRQSVRTREYSGPVFNTIVFNRQSWLIVLQNVADINRETALADLEEFERNLPINQGTSFTAEKVTPPTAPTSTPYPPPQLDTSSNQPGPIARIEDDMPPPPVPKPTVSLVPRAPISGGVLNGKAISLPKPPYPAIAKAAHASGTVIVQVTVDENGQVISAAAVSGHPLLQSSAVAAARQAKFSPTKLSGQPVKVTGVLTYNFVAP